LASDLCASDGAVLGGIEFGGTWHSISRASDYGVVGQQPRARQPSSRSIITEAGIAAGVIACVKQQFDC